MKNQSKKVPVRMSKEMKSKRVRSRVSNAATRVMGGLVSK